MPATEDKINEIKHSRLGKRPVEVPQGVDVKIDNGFVHVKGPKGETTNSISPLVEITKDDGKLSIVPKVGGPRGAQFQGLTRSILLNMIEGVHKGYEKSLDLYGVGYRAELKGSQLTIAAGLSHTVTLNLPEEIKAKVEVVDEGGQKRPRLILSSHRKDLLGQVAAHIRSLRPPEPYKGKGIRYTGERIREKAGKAGGKGK
ncbi:MAG: 50S ribosomal protein L6 [Myxococcales bacterium]|nr:MAG: 50S ribosomal protein L6 [Myxococcales bacterium]